MTASKLAGFTNVHALLEAERAELGGFVITRFRWLGLGSCDGVPGCGDVDGALRPPHLHWDICTREKQGAKPSCSRDRAIAEPEDTPVARTARCPNTAKDDDTERTISVRSKPVSQRQACQGASF